MSSSASVKLRYEKCLQIWGNAIPCGISQSIRTVLPNLDNSPAKFVLTVDRPAPPLT